MSQDLRVFEMKQNLKLSYCLSQQITGDLFFIICFPLFFINNQESDKRCFSKGSPFQHVLTFKPDIIIFLLKLFSQKAFKQERGQFLTLSDSASK